MKSATWFMYRFSVVFSLLPIWYVLAPVSRLFVLVTVPLS